MKVGDKITALYHDGRKFSGEVVRVEHTKSEEEVVWGDGSTLTDRTMIRIKTESGNHQSFYLDKCVSIR